MIDDMIRQIGTRAAYNAGKVLKDHFGQALEVTKKGTIDLVTQADIASEQMIIKTIREAFPDHAILAEESGLTKNDRNLLWVVDPLDGTTNFAHGLPLFSVSIAFAQGNDIIMGLVLNPVNGEFFSAYKGRGAYLNDRPIQVSTTELIIDSLLVTGFPYDIQGKADAALPRFKQCLTASQGVRRLGSAALDLCYVACGRFEAYWEENLKPWDVAAGIRIVEEAQGKITDFSNGVYQLGLHPFEKPKPNELLATNNHIHAEMVSLMQLKDPS